jgi:exonuclease SbcD
MKIMHTADIHKKNQPHVLADIVKCCDFFIARAIEEKPDLIAIAGDLFDEGVQLGSPASLAAIEFVYKCGNVAPTIVIRGTTSHDAEGSINALAKLKTLFPIYVTDRIEQVGLTTSGFLTEVSLYRPGQEGEGIQGLADRGGDLLAVISCLPSINKANVMATMAGSVADTSRETIDLVRDVLQGWGSLTSRQGFSASPPSRRPRHRDGLAAPTGQTMAGKDLNTRRDLRLAACDLLPRPYP